jgi:hypothetical protein
MARDCEAVVPVHLPRTTTLQGVKDLAGCERRASRALIRSLMQFDIRRLYLGEGHR